MRRISIQRVGKEATLAKSIYSEDGQVLLCKGISLTQRYIDRLKHYNISEIYIEDELSKDIDVEDIITDRTRLEAKVLIKNIMEESRATSHFASDNVKTVVNQIIDELLDNKDILVNLSDLKTVDDYTFAHSVNVCVLSLATGIKLGLNQLRLRDLGVGALLHDIGKMFVPQNILNKPAKLSDEEFETIKSHTRLGYEIVKSNPNISTASAYIVLAHHERFDGSGYPLKMKGEKIHMFAQIVAIADVYDALTSDRVYRKKVREHEAIEYISSLGESHFNMNIIQGFIKNIAVYPIGIGVVLSTGEKGIVSNVHKNLPLRPVIRVIYEPDGTQKEAYNEIDLSKELNIVICDTCEL